MAHKHVPQCPVEWALSAIGGRWKIVILCQLFEGNSRFNELRRALPGISQRVLAQQLRELERDSIVRRAQAASPPRVEYALTEFGRTLEPVLEALCEWGEALQERFTARTVTSPAAATPGVRE